MMEDGRRLLKKYYKTYQAPRKNYVQICQKKSKIEILLSRFEVGNAK